MLADGLLTSYGALLVGALVPIWCASRASIQVPKSVKKKWKELAQEGKEKAVEEDEEEEDEVERLTAEDAYLFPILGSAVLFGLFLAFKYLDKALLNRILGGYIAVMGIGALARALGDFMKRVIGTKVTDKLDKYSLALNKNKEEQFNLSFTRLHIFACIGAVALTFGQQYTQNWILSNLLALSLAYSAISLFYIDSFATGSALLGGLFLYDIWWVFGSKAVFGNGADVMVAVAKNFDAPIKIVFPKDLANAKDFTLLGLGDIVLPGSFLALALRFDYHQAIKRAFSKSKSPPRPSENFPRPYFLASFAAYIGGLVTTIFVMHHFRAAQPALLYLSPACVGSVTLLAIIRGESSELWGWEDGEEERKERERKEKEAKDKKEKDEKEVEKEPTVETTSIEVDAPGGALRSRAAVAQ